MSLDTPSCLVMLPLNQVFLSFSFCFTLSQPVMLARTCSSDWRRAMKHNATTGASLHFLLRRAFQGLNVSDACRVLSPQLKKNSALHEQQPQDMSTQQGCSWQRSEVTHVSVSREK